MARGIAKFGTRTSTRMPTVSTKAFASRALNPVRFAEPRPPGLLQRPKDYTKAVLLQFDPTNISFGRTGLTGES